mgnify:CR=1 FL=1
MRLSPNVTVNEDLLRRARELGINLSQTLEGALVEAVAAAVAHFAVGVAG